MTESSKTHNDAESLNMSQSLIDTQSLIVTQSINDAQSHNELAATKKNILFECQISDHDLKIFHAGLESMEKLYCSDYNITIFKQYNYLEISSKVNNVLYCVVIDSDFIYYKYHSESPYLKFVIKGGIIDGELGDLDELSIQKINISANDKMINVNIVDSNQDDNVFTYHAIDKIPINHTLYDLMKTHYNDEFIEVNVKNFIENADVIMMNGKTVAVKFTFRDGDIILEPFEIDVHDMDDCVHDVTNLKKIINKLNVNDELYYRLGDKGIINFLRNNVNILLIPMAFIF